MNFNAAADVLRKQVGDEKPKEHDARALLWVVQKYVPANSSDREIALLALGRIEGVAAMLAGIRDAT